MAELENEDLEKKKQNQEIQTGSQIQEHSGQQELLDGHQIKQDLQSHQVNEGRDSMPGQQHTDHKTKTLELRNSVQGNMPASLAESQKNVEVPGAAQEQNPEMLEVDGFTVVTKEAILALKESDPEYRARTRKIRKDWVMMRNWSESRKFMRDKLERHGYVYVSDKDKEQLKKETKEYEERDLSEDEKISRKENAFADPAYSLSGKKKTKRETEADRDLREFQEQLLKRRKAESKKSIKHNWGEPWYVGFDKKYTAVKADDSLEMERIKEKLDKVLEEIEKEKQKEPTADVAAKLTDLIKSCDTYTSGRHKKYLGKFYFLRPIGRLKFHARFREVVALRRRAQKELEARVQKKTKMAPELIVENDNYKSIHGVEDFGGLSSFGITVAAILRFMVENPIRLGLKALVLPFWAINEGIRQVVKWTGHRPQRHIRFPRLHTAVDYYDKLVRVFRGRFRSSEYREHWYDLFFTTYCNDKVNKDILKRMDLDMDMAQNDYGIYDNPEVWDEFKSKAKPMTKKEKEKLAREEMEEAGHVGISLNMPTGEMVNTINELRNEQIRQIEEQEEQKEETRRKKEDFNRFANEQVEKVKELDEAEPEETEAEENASEQQVGSTVPVQQAEEKVPEQQVQDLSKKVIQKLIDLSGVHPERVEIKAEEKDDDIVLPNYNIRLENANELIRLGEQQRTNNCYACSGSLAFNHFLKTNGEYTNDTKTNQFKIREYVPYIKPFEEVKDIIAKSMGIDLTTPQGLKNANDIYDGYCFEIQLFCGEGKEEVGSIYEIGDYFLKRSKNVAIHKMNFNISSDRYKKFEKVGKEWRGVLLYTDKEKKEADRQYKRTKALFLNKIYEILKTGNPVPILRRGHYVTIVGIEGQELIYANSSTAKVEHRSSVDNFLDRSGTGSSIDLTWFSKVGDIKKLTEDFKTLKYDKEKGFSSASENAGDVLYVSHDKGVDATRSVDDELHVTESIYVSKEYGISA